MVDGHCITGDTVISKLQSGHYNTGHRTVSKIFEQWGHHRQRGAMRRMNIKTVAPTGAIVPGHITDIWEVGERPVVTVATRLGRSLTATSGHPLLTPSGWAEIGSLSEGQSVALNGQPIEESQEWIVSRYEAGVTVQKLALAIGRSRRFVKDRLIRAGVELRPYNGGWNRGQRGRSVSVNSARSRSRRQALQSQCTICGVADDLQVHHVDRDPWNHDNSNLLTLCIDCHQVAHSMHAKLEAVKFDEIVSIRDAGVQRVFDLSSEPYHNFVANGFVVHNCQRTLHGEENALLQANYTGVITRGATAYVLHQPCYKCGLKLVQDGIVEVVYDVTEAYHDHHLETEVQDLFRQAGVRLRLYCLLEHSSAEALDGLGPDRLRQSGECAPESNVSPSE
jgi:deoxycytidylate deaminase